MKSAVTITPSAQQYLQTLFDANPNQVFRISVNNKGCSGHSYDYEWIDASAIGRGDDVQEVLNGKVAVRADSVLYLLGSQLDYESTLFSQGFKWINPLVKNTCGCGKSIGF